MTEQGAEDDPLSRMVERDIQELISTLGAKDDLTPMMLRFHLLTENLFERLILAHLPGGHGLLERANLTYHHKLELVHSFRLVAEGVISALRQLNKVRNSFSHVKDATASRNDIESIGRPLGKAFAELRKNQGHTPNSFATATFTLIFGALLGVVYKAEHPKEFTINPLVNAPPNNER